jgi:hypothetical protein
MTAERLTAAILTPPWLLCVGGWAAWVAVLWATGAFCENPPKANRQ